MKMRQDLYENAIKIKSPKCPFIKDGVTSISY